MARRSRPSVLQLLALEPRDVPANFTFAGLTFNSDNTPATVALLPTGTYDGAVVTNVAATTTGAVNFPDAPATGFDPNSALGTKLIGGTGVRALNLPNGNDGTANRAGIVLGYGAGTAIGNGAGNDVLIYESGNRRPTDTPPFSDPEPMMIQARIATTGQYTRWFYQPASAFGYYGGSTTIGAFATQIDLSNLGLPAGTLVDQFRLVNMTDEDRMDSATGVGFVRPEDAGATSTFLPTPGPLSTMAAFDATSYDPDPLYFAALQPVTTTGTNVRVTQTLTPTPTLTAGQSATLTVTVANTGTLTAAGVSFTAALPTQLTGATFTSTATGGATGNSATGAGAPANTLSLPAGSTVTYTITGTVSPTATGTATFTSAVGPPPAPVFDSDTTDNTATTSAAVRTVGDVGVTISNPTLTAGQPATYTVVVTNTGPSTVTVPLAVNLPAALTGITFMSTASAGVGGNTSPGTNAPSDALTLPAGATITYTITGTVARTATGTATATATVTPPATVIDGNASNNSATATTTVVAAPPNRPPVAVNDTGSALIGATTAPAVVNVLANDSDPDGDALSVSILTQAPLGTAVVNPDRTVTFTPNGSSTGTATFAYQISDGNGGTATAAVTVGVTRVDQPGGTNRAPVAVADAASAAFNTPVRVGILANDSDPDGDAINVSVLGTPANGTAALTSAGVVTYTPRAGFSGTDVFSYTISDGRGGTATASVTVAVAAGPVSPPPAPPVVPPVSRPDSYAVGSGVGQPSRAILLKPDGTARVVAQPFESAYTGGVRVAAGDVTGDGVPDLIAVPGDGGGPRVAVYDGATGRLVFDQFLYEPEARNGLFVAVGDVTGDGRADIVLAPGAGGGPRVRVYDYAAGRVVGNFFAYEDTFRGGARVAVGDLDGNGVGEIITAPGAGRVAAVRTFNLAGTAQTNDFVPPGPTPGSLSATTGLSIAAGDFAGGTAAEIAIGSAPGDGPPRVRAYALAYGKDSSLIATSVGTFQPYEDTFTGGVQVATYTPVGGKSRIVTGTGYGGGPRVQDFAADGTDLRLNRFQLASDDRGGVNVG